MKKSSKSFLISLFLGALFLMNVLPLWAGTDSKENSAGTASRDVVITPAPAPPMPHRDVVVRPVSHFQLAQAEAAESTDESPSPEPKQSSDPNVPVSDSDSHAEKVAASGSSGPSQPVSPETTSKPADVSSEKKSEGTSPESATPAQAPSAAPAAEETEKAPASAEPQSPLGPGVPQKAAEEGQIAVEKDRPRNVISDVEIKGNQIISSSTIINKIKVRRGDPLIQETINEDIKRLYASGFFQDIKVDVVKEGPGEFRVIFVVDEKPIVRQIIIEGNTTISESRLRKEIKLIEGQILDPKVVKEGVVAIQALYLNRGFKFAEVKSETDVNENTKEAILYILVDEGQKFRIKSVNFEGNKAIKSGKLKKLMRTKPRNLLFLHTGVFHEDHFENDLEKIKAYYQKAGYADVKVEPRFDYDREAKQMNLVIQIDEGQIYHAGEIKIQGNVLFPESEIWEVLSMFPGDVYSQFALNDDLAAIQKFYFYQGYIAVQIEPDVRFNRDTGKVDVTYTIQEGDLFFVNKVKIRGNTKTKDMVIRRELRIRPGEKFDGQKIDRSKERLEGLGYFEDVSYDSEEPEDATDPNKRDLIFKVKEKQTGQLSFGGGVSSVESLIGFAEISQNNFDLFNWPTFTGGGQKISLTGRLGTRTRDISFGFTEPYIFNKPYSYSLNLYDTTNNYQNTPWHEERIGASNTFGHQFTEYLSVAVALTAEEVKLKDVDSNVASVVLANGATNNLFKVRPSIAHDTRNNPLNPTRGHLLSLSSEFVVGDSSYYSAFISFSKFWTLFKTHTLGNQFRIGGMKADSSTVSVPVFDRYYAGGLGSVRGFGYRRVSPLLDNEPIGGQSIVLENIDYTFPIIDNFKGVFFIDIGEVSADSFKFTTKDVVMSVGPGVKINTPIGPMLFYYGYPVMHADTENKHGRFEFSIARAF